MRLRAGEVTADDVANAIRTAEFAVYEPESRVYASTSVSCTSCS